jgi:hypothetical protein
MTSFERNDVPAVARGSFREAPTWSPFFWQRTGRRGTPSSCAYLARTRHLTRRSPRRLRRSNSRALPRSPLQEDVEALVSLRSRAAASLGYPHRDCPPIHDYVSESAAACPLSPEFWSKLDHWENLEIQPSTLVLTNRRPGTASKTRRFKRHGVANPFFCPSARRTSRACPVCQLFRIPAETRGGLGSVELPWPLNSRWETTARAIRPLAQPRTPQPGPTPQPTCVCVDRLMVGLSELAAASMGATTA